MSESPKFDIFQRLEDKFPVKFMQTKRYISYPNPLRSTL